ncbi:MAG: hypothetical protein HQM07_08620, partial [Zetaproteobacteria bacterium]|nr:hypothetical protein [Zetaproteobacteria bacterium]
TDVQGLVVTEKKAMPQVQDSVETGGGALASEGQQLLVRAEQAEAEVALLQEQLLKQQSQHVADDRMLKGSFEKALLATYLQWLQQPQTDRFQRVQLWQEIAKLSILGEEEKQVALRMWNVSTKRVNRIFELQKAMGRLDILLVEGGGQENLMPHFETPWLEWLSQQVTLRRTPPYHVDINALRVAWLQVTHDVSTEKWPEDTLWQPLLLQLRQTLVSMGELDSVDVDLGVPSSFVSEMDEDAMMRTQAQAWLNR